MLGHPTIVCSVPTGTHTCFLLRLIGHLKQCVSWRGHTAPAIFLRWDTSGERGFSPCILPLSNYGGVFSLVVPAGGLQGPGGVEPSGGRRLQPVSGDGGGRLWPAPGRGGWCAFPSPRAGCAGSTSRAVRAMQGIGGVKRGRMSGVDPWVPPESHISRPVRWAGSHKQWEGSHKKWVASHWDPFPSFPVMSQ